MKVKAALNIPFTMSKSLWLMVTTYLPGPFGNHLRGVFWERKLRKMGKNVRIYEGVNIVGHPNLLEIGDNSWLDRNVYIMVGSIPEAKRSEVELGKTRIRKDIRGYCIIGNHVHIGQNCIIQATGGVKIGNHAVIAAGSNIFSGTCVYRDPVSKKFFKSMCVASPYTEYCVVYSPVEIEDYAFIGLNSVVLPGVKIGKGAIIGVGSVVQKNVPPFTIAVGVPARWVGKRPEF